MFTPLKPSRHFFWTLTLAAAISGCAQQSKDPVSNGAKFFVGYGCVQCHRIGGEGGLYGPDLTFIGFRKTSQWLDLWFKDPHAWKSNTPMPNFNLPDKVRNSLVAYLSTMKGELYRANPPWNSPALTADSAKRGAVIFERAGCVGCHGRAGVGGYPNNNVVGGKIPALIKVAEGYSKEELKVKIKTGVRPAKADMSKEDPMIFMPTWGQVLKEDEIDAIADYLISLKPKAKPGSDF